ncbi:MAG: helix-turn-helix transcriptional regulator, partial [Actinomycetes bacterium]
MTNDLYATPTTREIAARIRQIRKSKKLTLDGVAARSNGQLKSVVLGSYERGTRAISLARAI